MGASFRCYSDCIVLGGGDVKQYVCVSRMFINDWAKSVPAEVVKVVV